LIKPRAATYYPRCAHSPTIPGPPGARPLQGHRPCLRIRVGDYRVIYAVDDHGQVVTVAVVGPRRDVYRNLSL
jgi:mRNA interferase RelE/StbE